MKSLKTLNSSLASSENQLQILEDKSFNLSDFKTKLSSVNLFPLNATGVSIFQMNIGKMCNQTCKHCHVDAGPDRKEIMTKATMEDCLQVIENSQIEVVDLTGGAPEMNPNFRWLVEELSRMKKKIMVRCNLTIIMANKKYNDLPEFFAKHNIEVISSLPFYTSLRTNSQRGAGVFEDSIEALKMLNKVGYGKEGANLILNLVYNPSGAFLPGNQDGLEKEFKKELGTKFQIVFNNLFTITNLPISRFLDYLERSGNYYNYMEKLIASFNPVAAENVMCRNTISVSWDGWLYDCDFNQMLDIKVNKNVPCHIREFNIDLLNTREIETNRHCFGCTAGAGSSCGGAVV